jgi:exosortase B
LEGNAARAWLIALAGYAVMYLPIYWQAAGGIWQSDDHAHGAIVLVVVLWLFWTLRSPIALAPSQPRPWSGSLLFGAGLLLYVAGRAFGISIFEMASQIFVIAGGLLLMKGAAALRAAWFPVFYLIFMIPLPGLLVDAITGPLKQWISSIVVSVLYAAGYPIAQSGVVISIGQYQLLVADACSGLHSMFSLTALGTLFMYIMARKSRLHNAIMLASILPIAFVSNIVRVIALVLVTYHLGDEAGQGFLHGAAGMVLMLVALAAFFALDSLLAAILPGRSGSAHPPSRP